MSCGGRVYKGDTVTISVPFDVDDYSNLKITYTTTGDAKIVKTQEEVEIEDGFITYTFQPGELDLLPDGVIYYTIECDVLGVPNVDSTNTNLYLKTPAGYSGRTADEIYQEGYEAGLEDCSGSSCNLQIKSVVVTANTQSVSPDQGYDGLNSVSISAGSFGDARFNEGYESGYTRATEVERSYLSGITITHNGVYLKALGGYNRVIVNVPSGSTPCDCSSAYTEGYHDGEVIGKTEGYTSGYTDGYNQGQADCPECSGSTLVDYSTTLSEYWPGQQTFYPTDADGFRSVTIIDGGYGTEKYNQGYQSGYTAGQASCPECDCSSAITEAYNSGYTAGFDDAGTCDCSQSNAIAYNSGYTAGYDSGHTDGYNDGWDDGYDSGYNQGQEDCPECPSCDIETGNSYALTSEYSGRETLYPTTGYVGMESIEIYDDGYGDAKWQEGWGAGYDDGYQAGIMETDCSSAITEAYDDGYNQGYSDGESSGYTNGFNYGFSSGRTVGRREGYYQGEQSVIQSFLTGNAVTNYGGIDDYGYVVAYYYTPSSQMCVITGYDRDCDERWDDSFSSMSVDGGPWVNTQLYYYLSEGWHQIRFNLKDPRIHYAFNHNFPIESVEDPLGNMVIPYMDALKAVSIPEANQYQSGATGLIGTFKMNNGIRILSTSLKFFGVQSGNTYNGNALSGATNLNMIISHYQGNENVDIISEVQNGILFYPAGKSSTHSSALTGWTHMELF